MNKFLKRVKDVREAGHVRKTNIEASEEDLQALREFASDWNSLEEMRRKDRRSVMYAWGDQWGDLVVDPETKCMITEGDLIRKQGKVPLKNNMIAPILNNTEGQLRNAKTKPVCIVRDQREAKVGEMMSMAVEYVHDINETDELDASSFGSMETAGVAMQRLEFGINPDKGNRVDVWFYPVETARMFFDTSVEDPRAWGVKRIGELYDLTFDELTATFGKHVGKEKLKQIYGDIAGAEHSGYRALDGSKLENLNFYTPAEPNLCRVILGWRLENRQTIFCHDRLYGTYDYVPKEEMHLIEEENRRRREEALANGVLEEDLLLIEYEDATQRVWIYRYMSPWGHVLLKGESPYWHGEHNFVLGIMKMVNGRLCNFVEQFIDQQRIINRTATLIDFIRGASSKGALVVDEEAFESMTREEIVDEFVRYNGVFFVKPKNGKNINDVIRQLNGAASVAGDYELLNLQLKLINEISGVNTAMQGQQPHSGTPSSLYAQQAQNSALNLKGLFGRFDAFRKRRDIKAMKMIQQFYTDVRYLDIAGHDYSEEAKWYNPEKVKNAEIDLAIGEGNNTPAFQVLQNDFLYNLFQGGAIDVKTLLENTSYPFAAKVLESVKRNEMDAQQAMAQMQQQAAQAVSAGQMSPQMQKAMSNGNANEQDGIIRKA